MGRPAGRRNDDHATKRRELVERTRDVVLARGAGLSLRELAESVGTSVSTLRHYFGDRDTLLVEVAGRIELDAAPYVARAQELTGLPLEAELVRFLDGIVLAWRHFGVDRVHAATLAEGIAGLDRGRAYVQHVLEPSIQATEGLLRRLVDRGDLPEQDLRVGALGLLGPVLLALLHQDTLGGVACRPLDVPAYVRVHVRGWLAGHARA